MSDTFYDRLTIVSNHAYSKMDSGLIMAVEHAKNRWIMSSNQRDLVINSYKELTGKDFYEPNKENKNA